MTITLHSQATAPNNPPVTSVSPLDLSGSSKPKFSKGKTKPELYQTVTYSIIEALKACVKPWACPWE